MLKAIEHKHKGGWTSIDIYCDGQLVLSIDKTSDDETLNLFLTPQNSVIVESHFIKDAEWTHEILAKRRKTSET